jgi:hypothetical protein
VASAWQQAARQAAALVLQAQQGDAPPLQPLCLVPIPIHKVAPHAAVEGGSRREAAVSACAGMQSARALCTKAQTQSAT